jgi:hypothetical protein
MLLFIDLSLTAIQQYPKVVNFVQAWLEPAIGRGKVLKREKWFIEGHGIIGGCKVHTEYGSHCTPRMEEPTSGVLRQSLPTWH